MYFAGPICDGITCAPLLIIILASFLVPIGLGIVITWLFSKWLIKKINSKRKISLSSRQSLIFRAVLFIIVAGLALFVWWFPKSPVLKDFIYTQGKKEVSELYIFQSNAIVSSSVEIEIGKNGFQDTAHYRAETSLTFQSDKVNIIEE